MTVNKNQTIERALDIIFSLSEAGCNLTVGEIAAKVAIPESTAYRLIKTLEQYGLVERKSVGQIRLGVRILELARSLQQQLNHELISISRPIMEELTEKVNETSILCVRSASQVICVQSIETQRMLRLSVEIGKMMPLDRGASGKAILAFEQKQTIDQLVKAISDANLRRSVEKEIDVIREQGYCLTFGEVDTNIFGLAVPIYDINKRVIASLTVAGPTERWDQESGNEFIQTVVSSAHKITKSLAQIS
ncbi:IclR family transcriptional regulator [Lederbergia panacisoli]|uniref:IclR family transcriptional regulator n=1 Tax=Lederbergia panacisoli TaxID=1255251 RepID=UPI00214B9B86|nr:IclR family transcriptional regulator [Lederbergia panacisoli]MCR2821691.1 IclR family transcriptional regulator [Lederbergia panacisoli]